MDHANYARLALCSFLGNVSTCRLLSIAPCCTELLTAIRSITRERSLFTCSLRCTETRSRTASLVLLMRPCAFWS